jgi:hypothetical protein
MHPLRRRLAGLLAALGALGVLGAIGSYYVPGVLDRLGSQVSNRLPLDYDVITDRTATPNYVFPDSVDPADFAAVVQNAGGDTQTWIQENGGVLADEESVRLVLRGKSDSAVHIDDVRVAVLNRARPRAGWYNANDGCGGVAEPRIMEVNLDDRPPVSTWYVNGEEVERPAFTVTASEEEVFDVDVFTSHDKVNWVLEVDYNSAERSDVLRIDNRGKPFTVTSVANAKAYTDVGDGSGLVRTPSRDGSALTADDHPVC